MQQAKNLIRVRHVSDPSIPRRISEAISEPREDERDDEYWIRRVHAVDDVGD
jgi:hypothetical protein